MILHHCAPENPSSCHEHPVQDFSGVASGSFVAPDHEYPTYLELRLTATDSGELTDTQSVRLDPKVVMIDFWTRPIGLRLVVGDNKSKTPFSRTVIVGSTNSISAPSPQRLGSKRYNFRHWSDGGARTHNMVAPDSATTYTATYKVRRRR